jgi:hypothetical protein
LNHSHINAAFQGIGLKGGLDYMNLHASVSVSAEKAGPLLKRAQGLFTV